MLSIFYTPDFLLHDTGFHHPECSDRVKAIVDKLKHSKIQSKIDWIKPQPAEVKWIESIHTPAYRQFIEEAALSGKSTVDNGETLISHESYEVALLAAGGAIGAVDSVMSGKHLRAFSCGRPPGHHARIEEAMGFCLFNSIAIAARYSQIQYNLKRVCIIDFDVHHGNGTQESFYCDPTVLFCSIHQLPLYPHTGEFYETGINEGKGFTVNSPVPPRATLNDYLRAWKIDISPAIESFKPQLIFISAGFDAHTDDPLAQVNLTTDDFYTLTKLITQKADEHCQGKVVSILEGGYHLEALANAAEAHLTALLDLPNNTKPK